MTARRVINKFNRGEVSPLALARDDVRDITDTCELMENFLPIRLGPMRLRPGFEYIGDCNTPTSAASRSLSTLTRSIDDTILIETESGVNKGYIWDDGLAQTVANTGPSFTNGTFSGSITGWTAVGSTIYNAGHFSGAMQVDNAGGAYQSITVTASQPIVYLIEIEGGPCYVKFGDGLLYGADNLFSRMLFPGSTMIEVTPTTTQMTLSFTGVGFDWGNGRPDSFITSVSAVTAGTQKNVSNIVGSGLSFKQQARAASADVLFMSKGANTEPGSVRRIDSSAWASDHYIPLDGPFKTINASTVTLSASATTGWIGITASSAVFDSSDERRLLKLIFPDHSEQASMTSVGHATNPVAVMGYGTDRDILVDFKTDGAFTGSVEMRRYSAVNGASAYEVVKTYIGNASATSVTEIISDSHDGELYYYYAHAISAAGGTATIDISNSSPSCYGVAYIGTVASATFAAAMVYRAIPYASTTTGYWQVGAWGTGSYPQGVAIYEGRVVWASKNRVDFTRVDDYYSFGDEEKSSADAISRTIGFGPVDNISWVDSTNGLFIGLPTSEVHVRSSNFEEPLTLINTSLRPVRGSVGAKPVRSLATDDNVYFVSRDGKKLHELSYVIGTRPAVDDQMMLHPTICSDGIAQIEVTKHPETRIWVLTETGELRVLLKEPTEKVQAWSRVIVDGTVEAITTIPASGEDELWAIIRRNGNSRLYKMTQFSEIAPVDFCKRYTSPGTATLTGLSHLEGETVHVWADNQFLPNTYTVSSGQITIDSTAYTTVFVGKQITAKYKSNKLGQYVSDSVIGERKRVVNTALVMRDYSPGTLKVGRDFNHLRDLPNAVAGTLVTDYDEQKVSFGGTLDTDSRICLQATGPCTVMALAYSVNTSVNQSGGQN